MQPLYYLFLSEQYIDLYNCKKFNAMSKNIFCHDNGSKYALASNLPLGVQNKPL